MKKKHGENGVTRNSSKQNKTKRNDSKTKQNTIVVTGLTNYNVNRMSSPVHFAGRLHVHLRYVIITSKVCKLPSATNSNFSNSTLNISSSYHFSYSIRLSFEFCSRCISLLHLSAMHPFGSFFCRDRTTVSCSTFPTRAFLQ